jgi:DtxR family Mn-dependent transcriptional regulator
VVILLAASILWPERGLISRWRQYRRLSIRVLTEDVLKYLYHHEIDDSTFSIQDISDALGIASNKLAGLLVKMEQRGLIVRTEGKPELTSAGRIYALHIIRAHRLWETLLADRTGLNQTEWHAHAERREHELTPDDVSRLSVQLGHPAYDPHGDPIPCATGLLEKHNGKPLIDLDLNQAARIVHIKDKPEIIYAQLIAEELNPGMVIRVLEKTADRIVFWTEGDEHILAPLLAENISVIELSKAEASELDDAERLSSLDIGEKAEILAISRFSYGAERRRLFDLGFTKGTVVEANMASVGGDPIAYRVRGTLIALRSEQARLILIRRLKKRLARHGQ